MIRIINFFVQERVYLLKYMYQSFCPSHSSSVSLVLVVSSFIKDVAFGSGFCAGHLAKQFGISASGGTSKYLSGRQIMCNMLSVPLVSHMSLVNSLTALAHVTFSLSPIPVFLISPAILNFWGCSETLDIDSLVHVIFARRYKNQFIR